MVSQRLFASAIAAAEREHMLPMLATISLEPGGVSTIDVQRGVNHRDISLLDRVRGALLGFGSLRDHPQAARGAVAAARASLSARICRAVEHAPTITGATLAEASAAAHRHMNEQGFSEHNRFGLLSATAGRMLRLLDATFASAPELMRGGRYWAGNIWFECPELNDAAGVLYHKDAVWGALEAREPTHGMVASAAVHVAVRQPHGVRTLLWGKALTPA
jgi:hypothetical protein